MILLKLIHEDDNCSLCAALENETMTEYELEAGKYQFVLANLNDDR